MLVDTEYCSLNIKTEWFQCYEKIFTICLSYLEGLTSFIMKKRISILSTLKKTFMFAVQTGQKLAGFHLLMSRKKKWWGMCDRQWATIRKPVYSCCILRQSFSEQNQAPNESRAPVLLGTHTRKYSCHYWYGNDKCPCILWMEQGRTGAAGWGSRMGHRLLGWGPVWKRNILTTLQHFPPAARDQHISYFQNHGQRLSVSLEHSNSL